MERHPVHPDSRLLVTYARHSRKYRGIDVRCLRRGAAVRSVAPGVVDYVGTYMVRVRHDTAAGVRRSIYTHVRIDPRMRKGRSVTTGDRVGSCDVLGIKKRRKRLFPKGVLHFEWQRRSGRGWKRIDPLDGRQTMPPNAKMWYLREHERFRRVRPPPPHTASCDARSARRTDGAVCGLAHAGVVPRRHPG